MRGDSENPPQGALREPDGSVTWRVWAPNCKSVSLTTFSAHQCGRTPMGPQGRGYFVHREPSVEEGTRYAFRLDDDEQDYPDPASRWQPDGVHNPSAVFSPGAYQWSDDSWHGVAAEDLVIYELHVGTFTPEGTLDAVAPRMTDLVDLGVTAIELMPVAQFPGERNWGYDAVHPFAVQNSYGGPLALQRLVDAAHGVGLAVLLDVVYNHFGPEGAYFAKFGQYLTDHYRTPWGNAVNYDGPGSDAVRQFVTDNARLWIRDFHVDGLRLDAVHAIYDFSPCHILADIEQAANEEASRARRIVHVIAETHQNDVRHVQPVAIGGYGLDGVWSDDFHHAVHAFFTGERDGYYADFGARNRSPRPIATYSRTTAVIAPFFAAATAAAWERLIGSTSWFACKITTRSATGRDRIASRRWCRRRRSGWSAACWHCRRACRYCLWARSTASGGRFHFSVRSPIQN